MKGGWKTAPYYVAIGVDLEGQKDVLGLWCSANEGAKFWLSVLTDLKNRGVKDMLIVCVDGLKGFPQAIEAVFPLAQVQLCIVHLVRASLNYVNWKERKQVAADLKPIYRAATAVEAEMNLDQFIATWGHKYKAIGKLWKENWERVIPFFEFPEEVRKVIYTTNAVEALHRGLRKIIKNRGSFPSEEAAMKLLYLALQNIIAKWETVQHFKQALNQFEVLWGIGFARRREGRRREKLGQLCGNQTPGNAGAGAALLSRGLAAAQWPRSISGALSDSPGPGKGGLPCPSGTRCVSLLCLWRRRQCAGPGSGDGRLLDPRSRITVAGISGCRRHGRGDGVRRGGEETGYEKKRRQPAAGLLAGGGPPASLPGPARDRGRHGCPLRRGVFQWPWIDARADRDSDPRRPGPASSLLRPHGGGRRSALQVSGGLSEIAGAVQLSSGA
jgi:hypothetical protein